MADRPTIRTTVGPARRQSVAAEVHADAEALIAPLGVSREQRTQIRAQVRSEMEKAYGVSLCE